MIFWWNNWLWKAMVFLLTYRVDVISVFEFLINSKSQRGVFNLTSTNPVSNLELTSVIGKLLNRSTIFTIPTFVIRLVFGEMGECLLFKESTVYQSKLFKCKYRFIDKALKDILKV